MPREALCARLLLGIGFGFICQLAPGDHHPNKILIMRIAGEQNAGDVQGNQEEQIVCKRALNFTVSEDAYVEDSLEEPPG